MREQLCKAGKRLKHEGPAGTYAHQVFDRLLIDLSYNSSRLEGNTYSLLDTRRLILEGEGADTIYTLHYLLSDGLVEKGSVGKVRKRGVRIGGSTYIPSENSKWLHEQLLRVTEKAAQIKDPYEQSLFLLVQVSYLQAFSDVNKRTARLSANIPLIQNNLVPLSFNDVEREDYTSAIIAIYELQDVRPIVDLYLFSYLRTCALYDSTVHSLRDC